MVEMFSNSVRRGAMMAVVRGRHSAWREVSFCTLRLHHRAMQTTAVVVPGDKRQARSSGRMPHTYNFRHLSSSAATGSGSREGIVSALYNDLVFENHIKEDSEQRTALKYLDNLYSDVVEYDKKRFLDPALMSKKQEGKHAAQNKMEEEGQSWFSFLMSSGDKGGQTETNTKASEARAVVSGAPSGVYLHSGPGSGKTFTMDLFYEALPVVNKRRVHFNEFMLQVHRMLFSLRQRGLTSNKMMDECVEALYNEAWVLCFDEFQVTDIADAMILRTLFQALLSRGMVMVITSNRAPDELYKNGIQRDLFLPFIEDIKELFHVVNVQSKVDYRMFTPEKITKELKKAKRKTTNSDDKNGSSESNDDQYLEKNGAYFVQSSNSGLEQAAMFERLYKRMTKGDLVHASCLRVQGRTIHVPEAARNDDVARFTFDELCGQPRGAADYYAIASSFHTVFMEQVPQLKLNSLNQLRRFITMVDTFYDQKVVLVMSGEVPMHKLLDTQGIESEDDVTKAEELGLADVDVIGESQFVHTRSNIDEVFAFARTRSRLHEMNRGDYLRQARHRLQDAEPSPVRFLSQFKATHEHKGMAEIDIKQMWGRYDKDKNGKIDAAELNKLLEDIMLFNSGHRHVPREVFMATQKALSPDEQLEISYESFETYFKTYGLTIRG